VGAAKDGCRPLECAGRRCRWEVGKQCEFLDRSIGGEDGLVGKKQGGGRNRNELYQWQAGQ
jgi:hypothetical protein